MSFFLLERVSSPSVEPLTRAEMKSHLRVDITDDDDAIDALITASREWVEDFTGRALIDQEWRLTIDNGTGFLNDVVAGPSTSPYSGVWNPSSRGEIFLRRSPVLEVTSFATLDADGAEVGIDLVASYALRESNSKWPRLVPKSGVSLTAGVSKIVFRAGYSPSSEASDGALADAWGGAWGAAWGDAWGSTSGADTTLVPVRYKQAMKLYAEALYDRDERMMPLLLKTAESLIRPERVDLSLA